MRLLVFSDLHLHPFPQFAKITKQGINSRLEEGLNALDTIHEAIKNYNPNLTLFSGDFFHQTKIDAPTLELGVSKLDVISTYSDLVGIAGNHGLVKGDTGFHIEKVLAKYGGWFFEPYIFDYMGVKLGIHPYVKNGKEVEEWINKNPELRVAIIHQGINGARINCSFVSEGLEDSINPNNIRFGPLLIIAGHYHRPQQTQIKVDKKSSNTFLIPGSPLAHSFNDIDSKRGFWTIDNFIPEFHEILGPKFMRILPGENKKMDDIGNNYVHVILPNNVKQKTIDHTREVLESKAKGYVLDIEPKSTQYTKRDENIKLELTIDKLADSWWIKKDGKNKDRQILGQQIVDKAEKE